MCYYDLTLWFPHIHCKSKHTHNLYIQGEESIEEVGGEPGLWGGGNRGGNGKGKMDLGGGGGGGEGVKPGIAIGGKGNKGGGLDGGGWNGLGISGGGLDGGGWNGFGKSGGGLGGWNGFGINGGLGGWNGLGIKGGGENGFGINGGGWNGFGIKGGGNKGFGGKKKKSSWSCTNFFIEKSFDFSKFFTRFCFLGFGILYFLLQNFGFFIGLNEKIPAEKMCSFCIFFLRLSENEVEVEAIEQCGSLLLINLKLHPLILFTCFFTIKGSFTLNSPCSLVFTSS